MIKSIEFENFQSHKHSILQFVPGVNIIIGLSDAGKSAVIRTLKWCMRNNPSGDEFRSWWGGDTVSQINFDNGSIARIKKKGFNGYILTQGKKVLEFTAIKTDVPDEVQQFINMDDVNLQQQLDSSFLLSKTSGEVAKYFNKIANLDKIDTATSNINSWISQLTQDIKYKEADLKENSEKLETFNYLEKLEIDVENLEVLENTVTIKQKKRKTLNSLLSNIVTVNEEIESYSDIISIENQINNLLDKIEKKKKKEKECIKFYDLIKTIKKNTQEIEEYSKVIPAGDLIDSLIEKSKILEDKKSKKNILKRLVGSIGIITDNIEIADKRFETLHKEFEKNMPDVCPLCGYDNKPKIC
jgi:exonuclease SbcC